MKILELFSIEMRLSVYLNPEDISNMFRTQNEYPCKGDTNGTVINMRSGSSFFVRESIEFIVRQIDEK